MGAPNADSEGWNRGVGGHEETLDRNQITNPSSEAQEAI